MDVSSVCRTCLKSEHLNPIFPISGDWNRYSSAVHHTIGIKIEPNDGLPQNMCSTCINIINQSSKFRKNCKHIQDKLLKYLNTGGDINSLKKINETCKDLVISENIINTQIKIELETDSEESNRTEYIAVKAEVVSDDEDDDDDKKPLIHFVKETDSSQKGIDVETEKPKTTLFKYDLSLLSNSKNSSKQLKKIVKCNLSPMKLSIQCKHSRKNRTHPRTDLRKIKCDHCDNYLRKEKLNWHMSRKHGIKKKQKLVNKDVDQCGYCSTKFNSKEDLKQHVVSCTDKEERRKQRVNEWRKQLSECNVCHKKMQKSSIRNHKAVAHAGKRPVCEHCGRTCSNVYRLNEHYRAKHGYDKLKCSLCDFKTASIASMRNHDRWHRGEKPFVCETCDAKFHTAYILAQHKMTHQADKPLKCDLCTASFKMLKRLNAHKKACHGPPLYRCSACPRIYSCRNYVVKHMRKTHHISGPLPPLRGVNEAPGDDDEDCN